MKKSPLYLQDLQAAGEKFVDGLSNKKILITGATGLIGSFATDTLIWMNEFRHADIEIYAAGRSEAGVRTRFGDAADREYFHYIAYDARNPVNLDFKTDFVLHAACSAHPMAYAMDPVGTMQANLTGVMYLLEYIRNCENARFIFLSTGETYGENPELKEGFSEESSGYINPMNPRSCYPESKRAAETLCASYGAQYGVDAMVARLCHVYGPTITATNSRADAQFLRKALAGEDIVMKSSGAQVRSYCYVSDAVAALFTMLLRGEKGNAYNVANRDSANSIREYAEILAEVGEVNLTFDLPPETEKAGYTKITRAVLNPAKLEKLGWKPRYSLRMGLEHTFKISREQIF